MKKTLIIAIFLLLQALSINILARDYIDPFKDLDQNYEAGLSAYNNKKWALAYEKLKPIADLEYPPAQYLLAGMYMNGWGVTKSPSIAAKLLKSSAKELPQAEFLYGGLNLVGHGVKKNELIAEKYIRSAAEKGVLEAMDHVGDFYKNGTVYPVNYVEACIWYEAAATLGYANSSGKCSKLVAEKKFTKSQVTTIIETAKRKASEIRNHQ